MARKGVKPKRIYKPGGWRFARAKLTAEDLSANGRKGGLRSGETRRAQALENPRPPRRQRWRVSLLPSRDLYDRIGEIASELRVSRHAWMIAVLTEEAYRGRARSGKRRPQAGTGA